MWKLIDKKTLIIIIAIWVAAGIAIVLLVRWALGSPSLETLIAVNISISVTTFAGIFTILANLFTMGMRIIDTINNHTKQIIDNANGNTKQIIETINSTSKQIIDAVNSTSKQIIDSLDKIASKLPGPH